MKKYKYQQALDARAISGAYKFSTLTLSAILVASSILYLQHYELSRPVVAAKAPTEIRSSQAVPFLTIPAVPVEPIEEKPQPTELLSESIRNILSTFNQQHPDANIGINVSSVSGFTLNESLNQDQAFDAASLYKTLAAYRVLQLVDEGALDLEAKVKGDTTLGECLVKALSYSDNPCGIILQKLARPSQLDGLLANWGLTETSLTGYYPATSAADQAALYTRIYLGTGLSSESHKLLTNALGNQQINDRLPDYEDLSVLHKTGDVNGTVNSATVVSMSNIAYQVMFLSDNWDLHYEDKYLEIIELQENIHTEMSRFDEY